MNTKICCGRHLLRFQVRVSLLARTYLSTLNPKRSLFRLSLFYFPGPVLIIVLLDRFGRKKCFAFCLLMISLFLLPMYWYAVLGRYVCALCSSATLPVHTADVRLFWALMQHAGHDPAPHHQSLRCAVVIDLLHLRIRGATGVSPLMPDFCGAG